LPVDSPSPWKRAFLKVPLWGWLAGLVLFIVIGIAAPDPDDDASEAELTTPTSAAEPPVSVVMAEAPASTIAVTTTEAPAVTIAITTTNETVAVTSLPAVTLPPADTAQVASALLALIEVADPDPARAPYERDTYDREGWGDFDGDCITTRHEILVTYSLDPVLMDPSGCFVESGRWIDPYTGSEYTSASDVTIDHVVPLAEAHRSGAWRWTSIPATDSQTMSIRAIWSS
jgi:hypothetical protein